MLRDSKTKILVLVAIGAVTVAIHYGWVLESFFGHHPWVHAVHSRFCYIPIAIAASWFGLRGGLIAATGISLLIIPYLFGVSAHMVDLSGEFVEIFFYYSIGILIGALIDRELKVRRQKEHAQRELERSQQLSMLGQMAAGVAHEIKNPLASIKGAFEILCDKSTAQPDRDEFQGIVTKEIRRINNTVTDFLEFGRPRAARLEPLDFSSAVAASLRQIEPQLAASGISLVASVAPEICIEGDREKLHQVLLNLVLNAAEASSAGSTIDVQLARSERGKVVLTIRDHGKGIEPSELTKVMEPFYTTKTTGSGLGLAITNTIIANHHGKLAIHSKPGEGTTVVCEIPASREKVKA